MSGSREVWVRPTSGNTITMRPWIELEMVNSLGEPQADQEYRVEFPDGSVAEGFLNSQGKVLLETTQAGTCIVRFPGLNQEEEADPADMLE